MGKGASTYKTFLLINDSGWKKLIDIRDYSDTEGDPDMLDTSTLSDRTATGIPGQPALNTNTYTVLYNKDTYKKLQDYVDDKDHEFALAFGGTEDATTEGKFTAVGTEGAVKWTGRMSTKILGKGFNEVREAQITISSTVSPKWVDDFTEGASLTVQTDATTPSA